MRSNTSTIWMVAQREFVDQFRDWRIVVPMFVLVTLFPFIADDTTRQAVNFMNRFGGSLILDHLIPFVVLVIASSRCRLHWWLHLNPSLARRNAARLSRF